MAYNSSSMYSGIPQGSDFEPSSSRRRAYSEADAAVAYDIPAEYMQDLVAHPQWPSDSSNPPYNLPFQDRLYPAQENFTYANISANSAFVPAEGYAYNQHASYMISSTLEGSPQMGHLSQYSAQSPDPSDSGNEGYELVDSRLPAIPGPPGATGEDIGYRHVIGSEEGRRVSEARRKREARHQCHLCGKGLTSRDNLTNHINFHFNIKPYDCPHCAKPFTTKADCTRHSKKCHGGA